ncbi:MAG: AEC family transporter [Hyphomicrobiales bacterium]|nr:AEC family transporter [Hyphomicrobiales bacterium]
MPASLFVAMARTPSRVLLSQWPLFVTFLVAYLLLYAVAYAMQRRLFRLPSGDAAIQALTIAFPNNAAAGLPLIAAVFGPGEIVPVALSIAVGSIFLSPLTLGILEANKAAALGGKGVGAIAPAIGHSFLKPVVLAPIVGVIFSLGGIPLAPALLQSLQLIGQAAGGVALFVTGVILSAQSLLLSRNVISGAILKNVAHPLIGYALILVLPMSHETARAAILLLALPSGFFGVLFGLRYGKDSREAGSTLIVSSLASIVTLAIALVLTAGW